MPDSFSADAAKVAASCARSLVHSQQRAQKRLETFLRQPAPDLSILNERELFALSAELHGLMTEIDLVCRHQRDINRILACSAS